MERLKGFLNIKNPENIIYISAVCVFLPYQISAIILLAMVGYVLATKSLKKEIFCHSASFLIPVFSVLTLITALWFRNWLGVAVSVIFFLIFVLGFYMRTVMTTEIFEKMLSVLCNSSIFASAVILFEKILYFTDKTHRCFGDFMPGQTYSKIASFYFSPTYLSSSMAVIVIICAYKVIYRKGNLPYYYLVAFLSMLTIYFAGSMFVWVNVFAALATFLIIIRHRKLLAAFLAVVALAGVVLFFVPDILPRLSESMLTSDNRILIWNLSVASFSQSPFFGQGFQTYGHIANGLIANGVEGIYSAYHAHNIILEPLLSFGIVGTSILGVFFFAYFQSLTTCMSLRKKSPVWIIILSVTTGLIIHCIIDMTMLWIQPMILYCLIFGGIGADEKIITKLFKRNS